MFRYDSIFSDEEDNLTLNGHVLEGDDRWDLVTDWVAQFLFHEQSCPYCGSRLWVASQSEEFEPVEEYKEEVRTSECPRCAYWHCYWQQDVGLNSYGCPSVHMACQISKLGVYDESLPEGFYAELVQQLRIHPGRWHSMSPTDLEKLVAEIFRNSSGYSEVFHVGSPDDGGVDVLFIENDTRRWLVQVKRRQSPDASEGVATIRNLLGAMVLKESQYGIVVSTADHFTYRAFEAKQKASEVGYILRLIDRGKLDRLVDSILPSRPWIDFVMEKRPDWAEYFIGRIPDRKQLRITDIIQPKNAADGGGSLFLSSFRSQARRR